MNLSVKKNNYSLTVFILYSFFFFFLTFFLSVLIDLFQKDFHLVELPSLHQLSPWRPNDPVLQWPSTMMQAFSPSYPAASLPSSKRFTSSAKLTTRPTLLLRTLERCAQFIPTISSGQFSSLKPFWCPCWRRWQKISAYTLRILSFVCRCWG